jgi:hypothetical protein
VTVLRLTSDIHAGHPIRVTVRPEPANGLRAISHVMIDKAISVPRERIGKVSGHLDDTVMAEVGRALAAFLGLDTAAARQSAGTRQSLATPLKVELWHRAAGIVLLKACCLLLKVIHSRNLTLFVDRTSENSFFEFTAYCLRTHLDKHVIIIRPNTEIIHVVD